MNDLLTAEDQADESDTLIQPGGDRPFFVPWCASCKDTVDTFTVDAITNPFRLGVQATCHGQTQGIWVLHEDLLARKRDGKPVVMFKRGAFDRVRR
jgi:hypothetical protein